MNAPRSLVLAVVAVLGASLVAGGCRQDGRQEISLVVTAGTVVTMDRERHVLTPGAVAINGAVIVAVDRPEVIAHRYRPAQGIDASDQVVLPGLINTHTHAPMVMFRGLADDLALMDWLEKYIFPAEAKTVSPEFVEVGTRLAALEMIQSGTTTFTDMYYFEEVLARVTKAAGLRGVLGETIIEFPAPDARTPADSLARAERFLQEFAKDDLIVPAVAPHSMYTLSPADLAKARDLAAKYDAPLLVHVAETEAEVGIARERYQQTPFEFLDSIGLLGPRFLAAHGIWVTDADIGLMKARGVGVSHNPESNMKLASGVAPLTKYLTSGVAMGLGTDGAASNNDLDMFEAMRQAALLHKVSTRDPTVAPAVTVLDLATLGGARALGMGGQIGSLEAGKRADLIAVSMTSARQTPLYDPVSHLVYVTRGDDVQTTIVNGRVLMRNRRMETLDAGAVIADARRLAERVRDAVRTQP